MNSPLRIQFTSLELGMIKDLIVELKAETNVRSRKFLISKIQVFLYSMISFRHPTIKRTPVTLFSIEETHFIESQDTLYTFYYKEKDDAKTSSPSVL